MKREIKFKAWLPEMEYFVYTFDLTHNGLIVLHINGVRSVLESPVLLQYTGLKDNNGIEIYEGDIVRLDVNDLICQVVRLSTNSGFKLYNPRNKWYFETQRTNEVIGNIYENPKLLETVYT